MSALDHLFLIFHDPAPLRRCLEPELQGASGLDGYEWFMLLSTRSQSLVGTCQDKIRACRIMAYGRDLGLDIETAIAQVPFGPVTREVYLSTIAKMSRDLSIPAHLDTAFNDAVLAIKGVADAA